MKRTLNDHELRVEIELLAAGIPRLGTAKYAFKYLARVIESDEHIRAAVFGRYTSGSGSGLLKLSTGMLVATNERVIFLDHKPGYTNIDEISYGVVAGVKVTSAGPFSSIILHTRMGDYCIRFAGYDEIDKLRKYIESRIETINHS